MLRTLDSPNLLRNFANSLTDRYRCLTSAADFEVSQGLSRESGYFRLGPDTVCYGQCSAGQLAKSAGEHLHDAICDVVVNGSVVHLPFDPAQVVDNLRCERYPAARGDADRLPANHSSESVLCGASGPGCLRAEAFQKVYFRGWEKIPFPQWPVDTSVENIFEQLLALSMKSKGVTRVPFIWFWPEGAPSCTMMTHDVETPAGLNFCPQLMDLNDSFGIKSSFQIIPEKRYTFQIANCRTSKLEVLRSTFMI